VEHDEGDYFQLPSSFEDEIELDDGTDSDGAESAAEKVVTLCVQAVTRQTYKTNSGGRTFLLAFVVQIKSGCCKATTSRRGTRK
jgi:hypothetical protein